MNAINPPTPITMPTVSTTPPNQPTVIDGIADEVSTVAGEVKAVASFGSTFFAPLATISLAATAAQAVAPKIAHLIDLWRATAVDTSLEAWLVAFGNDVDFLTLLNNARTKVGKRLLVSLSDSGDDLGTITEPATATTIGGSPLDLLTSVILGSPLPHLSVDAASAVMNLVAKI